MQIKWGGGGKYVSTILASIKREEEKVLYSFCNDKEALRAAIKIYANNIKHILKQDLDSNHIDIKINDILYTANEVNDIKKLQECYKKLKCIVDSKKFDEKYTEQYEEELEECKDEVINSAENIIDKLNEYDIKNDLFRYAFNNRNKLENRKLLFNMQKNILSADDYKEALKYYKELQRFTINVLQEYNRRSYYDKLSIPTFIDEEAMQDRLQEVSIDFSSDASNDDINIDTILEEIFCGREDILILALVKQLCLKSLTMIIILNLKIKI